MSKKLVVLIAAVLAFGLIAAGCGGDDEDETTDEAATTAETTTDDTTTEETTTEDTTAEDGAGGAIDSEAAVEQCKQAAEATPQLSDEAKGEIVDLCEQAASGDEEEVREASRQACVTIAEDTLPEGQVREQAIESCQNAIR